MAGAPDTSSAQGWVSATFDAAQLAGSSVEILAADGTVVYSSVDIDSGAEYQVVVDGGTTTATAGEHTGGGMGGGMGGGRGGPGGTPPN